MSVLGYVQGYFQLKANPGAWLLELRQGRSSELYDIVRCVVHCLSVCVHVCVCVCVCVCMSKMQGEN